MAGLKEIMAAAKKFRAKVEDDKCGYSHDCRIEAPHRKVWACDGIHELVDSAYIPWKPDYDSLLSRMNHGLEDCTDPDCEWCEGAPDDA